MKKCRTGFGMYRLYDYKPAVYKLTALSVFCLYVPLSNGVICDIGTNEAVEARHHGLADIPKLDASGKSVIPGMTIEPLREKTNNLGSDQARHKPTCTVTEDG